MYVGRNVSNVHYYKHTKNNNIAFQIAIKLAYHFSKITTIAALCLPRRAVRAVLAKHAPQKAAKQIEYERETVRT
jgi:hypothetical protein